MHDLISSEGRPDLLCGMMHTYSGGIKTQYGKKGMCTDSQPIQFNHAWNFINEIDKSVGKSSLNLFFCGMWQSLCPEFQRAGQGKLHKVVLVASSGCDEWLWSINTQPSPAWPGPAPAWGRQGFTSPQLSRMPFSHHFIQVYSKMETVSDPNAAEAQPKQGLSAGQLLTVFPWIHLSSRPPHQPILLHPGDKCWHHTVDGCSGKKRQKGYRGLGNSSIYGAVMSCHAGSHSSPTVQQFTSDSVPTYTCWCLGMTYIDMSHSPHTQAHKCFPWQPRPRGHTCWGSRWRELTCALDEISLILKGNSNHGAFVKSAQCTDMMTEAIDNWCWVQRCRPKKTLGEQN